ncbi:MAG: hypothetical protein H8E40_03540 [Chloroflexi bacterium]|nr:hypothetical protein [Chloroflexota bacterium]
MSLHLGDAFLRIIVQTGDLIKGMNQAKSITKQATTEIEQQWDHFFGTLKQGHNKAAQVVESSTESMQTNWLGVAAAYGAVAAAGTMLIKQIAMTSMRTQELGIVAGITAENMKISKGTLDEQVESLKKLGMTTQASMTLTTQFMRSELDLADASKLARAAQNLAIVAMQDSSQAAMTMTRAITMQRPILLRQYGIIGGLSDAYDAMGKQLGILSYRVDSSGKTLRVWSRELTVAEKRQSILNMIMEQSSGLAGAYEAAMDAPGKAMRSFGRHVMTAQEAVGKYWLPALDKAVKVATSFVKAFNKAPEIVHQLAGALLVGVTVVAAITAAVIAKTIAMTALTAAVGGATISLGAFTVSLAVATAGLTLIVAAIVMLGIKLHEHAKNMEIARQEAFESSETYKEYARKMEEAGASAHALSEEIWELSKAEKDAATAQRILLEEAEYDDYRDEMEAAGLSTKTLAEELWEAEKAQAALRGTTSKSVVEIEKEAQARKDLLDNLRNSIATLENEITVRGVSAETVKASAESRIEANKQLVLQDAALREVALALGLVTQAEIDYVYALESSDRAMLSYAETVHEVMQNTDTYMQENIARALERQKAVQEAYQESLVTVTESLKNVGDVVSEGYTKLVSLAEGYRSTIVQLETEIGEQRVEVAQQSAAMLEQIETALRDTTRELRVSTRSEELSQLTQTSGQVLSLIEASYRSQVAAVEAATKEQLELAERANAERQVAAAKVYQQELVDLQKHISSKLMMWITLHEEELKLMGVYDRISETVKTSFDGQLSLADQFTVKYQALMSAMAEGNAEAISTIMGDIQELWDTFEDEMGSTENDIEVAQNKMNEAAESGWAKIHNTTASALSDLAAVVQNYQTNILTTWDSFNASVENSTLNHQISLRENEINYQRSRQELIAKANAEINAMSMAGLDEKAANRQAKLDEDLTMLEYNYETQKAWAAWHWEIQQLMQEQAHHLRLAEMAEFAMNETKALQAQAQAELDTLLATLNAAAMYAGTRMQIDADLLGSAIVSSEGQIGALEALIEAYENAAAGYKTDMEANLAAAKEASDKIQAMIEEGPALPEMPDFGQWVDDFSGGMAKSAKETAVSVTKTLKEAIIDIADGFSAAMEIFTEVAKYKTPTGLAEGMKNLRMDIEEAIRQMYKAHQNIGEEGIKAASRIAEAAHTVVSMMSAGLEAFAELDGYGKVSKEKIRSFVNDVYEIIGALLGMGARWHNAGHKYEDVVKVSQEIAGACATAVGWITSGVEAFTALGDYRGIMPGVIDAFASDIELVLDIISEMLDDFADEEPEELKTVWMKFAATLLNTIASMIGDLSALASLRGKLRISISTLWNLVRVVNETVETLLKAIDELVINLNISKVTKQEVAWTEFAAELLSIFRGIVEDLTALSATKTYRGITPEAVSTFFNVLRIFLVALKTEMGKFEDDVDETTLILAQRIGSIMTALGDSVVPLLHLVSIIWTPDKVRKAVESFFDVLGIFVDVLETEIGKFEDKVDEGNRDLTKVIGETIQNIASAVEPLLWILSYRPEIVNIPTQFQVFFNHLNLVLEHIDNAAEKWLSQPAEAFAITVSTTIGNLALALDLLIAFAEYGVGKATSVRKGFERFWDDIEIVLGKLTGEQMSFTGFLAWLEDIVLPELAWGGETLGEAFISGMIRGLNNKAGALYNRVIAIVEAMIAAAESAAGVASPSSFTTSVGEDMALGLAQGFATIKVPGSITQTIKDIITKISSVATDELPSLEITGWSDNWIKTIDVIVGMVEQATLKFNSLEGYVNALPKTLAAGIRNILEVIDDIFDDFADEEPGKLKAPWLDHIIESVINMIGELEKFVNFEKDMRASSNAVFNLMYTVNDIISQITISEITPIAHFDAIDMWTQESNRLEKSLVNLIASLRNIASLESIIQTNGVGKLIGILGEAISLEEFYSIGPIVSVIDMINKRTQENRELVSSLVNMINSLEIPMAFEIIAVKNNVNNLVQTLRDVTDNAVSKIILGLKNPTWKDSVKSAWASFIAKVVDIFTLDDLETFATPKLSGVVTDAQNLIGLIENTVKVILLTIDKVTDDFVDKDSARSIKSVWTEIVVGLASTFVVIIEDLKTLVALKGKLTSVIEPIQSFVIAFDNTIGVIVGQTKQIVTYLETENWIRQAKISWAKFIIELTDLFTGFTTYSQKLTAFQITSNLIGLLRTVIGEILLTSKGFDEFFGQLEWVLEQIELEKERWVTFDTAMVLGNKIALVMEYLRIAVEPLVEVADQFADNCSVLFGHITDGISSLNSLPRLEMDLYLTGTELGASFIQGLIEGLISSSSTLFHTITRIIETVITVIESIAPVFDSLSIPKLTFVTDGIFDNITIPRLTSVIDAYVAQPVHQSTVATQVRNNMEFAGMFEGAVFQVGSEEEAGMVTSQIVEEVAVRVARMLSRQGGYRVRSGGYA